MIRSSHGWRELSAEDKREIIDAIVEGRPSRGPFHAELDITDRCNVACYFCNQQDLRTAQQLSLECTVRLIDELAQRGLRSVRLSGGGDPLFHREIVPVLRHLRTRGIVIDNVNTNAVALTAEVARELVDAKAREVVVSLNAADPADYHRMMSVKPALFDKVVENVRALVAMRAGGSHPGITLQFLLDRGNAHRVADMYRLGRSIGVDRIAMSPVLEIPRDRLEHDLLLGPQDEGTLAPLFREVLEADRELQLLEPSYMLNWGGWLERLYAELAVPIPNPYAQATSFDEKRNGGCFFAWYSMAVTGTGDVRPCCYLLQPDYEPLGNVATGDAQSVWDGAAYEEMRAEMREVLLGAGEVRYDETRFRRLKRECVEPNLCWLKNGNFRYDEEFYRDLDEALMRLRRERAVTS